MWVLFQNKKKISQRLFFMFDHLPGRFSILELGVYGVIARKIAFVSFSMRGCLHRHLHAQYHWTHMKIKRTFRLPPAFFPSFSSSRKLISRFPVKWFINSATVVLCSRTFLSAQIGLRSLFLLFLCCFNCSFGSAL